MLGNFEWLTVFANLAALALYFLCAIATLVLRKRDVRMDGKPFIIPGGPLVPIAACVAIAWLFFETARDGEQFKGLVIALAVIFVAVRPAGAASQAPGGAGTREIACCGGIRCCSPSGSRFAICCDERRHTLRWSSSRVPESSVRSQ